jgi:hypothetical protein
MHLWQAEGALKEYATAILEFERGVGGTAADNADRGEQSTLAQDSAEASNVSCWPAVHVEQQGLDAEIAHDVKACRLSDGAIPRQQLFALSIATSKSLSMAFGLYG